MATDPRRTRSLPPRRGAVKAQIFESLKKSISSMASKAGEVLAGNRGEGGGGDGRTSTSTTPPPSSYESDADPNASN